MGWLDFFKRKSEPEQRSPFEQELESHGLLEWLRSGFSPEERDKMEKESLRRKREPGEVTPEATVLLLRAIAPKGALGRRVLEKAEAVAQAAGDPLLVDRLQTVLIDRFLNERGADSTALDQAIAACRKMIANGPAARAAFTAGGGTKLPRHHGFEQLAVLREKQGAFEEAIALSRQAREQGWAGDWEQRIDRCERKLEASRQDAECAAEREEPVVPEGVSPEEDAGGAG